MIIFSVWHSWYLSFLFASHYGDGIWIFNSLKFYLFFFSFSFFLSVSVRKELVCLANKERGFLLLATSFIG